MNDSNITTTEELEAQLNPDMDDVADFESVDLSEPESKDEVKEETKEEEVTEPNLENIEELEVKEDKKEKEEPKKEEKPAEEEKESKSQVKLELDKKESKSFMIQTNEKESVEIPADAKVKIKVDGEIKEFTMQELANDKSGEVAYDKKFSELGNDKKTLQVEKSTFKQESGQLMSQVTDFVKAVQSQDASKALEALGTLSGENPIDLREHFLTLMRENSRAYEKLSPEQQKELDNKQKIEYLEQRDQNREVQIAKSQEQANMTSQVIQFRDKLGIDDATLVSLKDKLEEKSIDLSFEALEKLHKSNGFQDKASVLLEQVDPSLKGSNDYVDEVKDFISKNSDLSDEEMIDCIKTAIAETQSKQSDKTQKNSSSKTLQNRISKSNPNSTSETKSVSTEDVDDIIDFDEVTHQF